MSRLLVVRVRTISAPGWLSGTRVPLNHLLPRLGQPCPWPPHVRSLHDDRKYHRAGVNKEKPKASPVKKKPEVRPPPPRYKDRPPQTLRPEDASAAAHAAHRRGPSVCADAFSDKRCPPCPPQRPPPPPPCPTKQPLPTRRVETPQPTRTVLPRDVATGLPPQFDAGIHRSRPVIAPIRVCTPQEVRKLFEPEPLVCPPVVEPITFRQKVRKVIVFTVKGALAAFVVWMTVDLGIWGDSDKTVDLLSMIRKGEPEYPPPRTETITYKMKDTWNRGVVNTFWLMMHLPDCACRVWGYAKKNKDEPLHSPPEPRMTT